MTVKNEEKVNGRELSPQAKEILASLEVTKKELEKVADEIDAFRALEGLDSRKTFPRRKEMVFEQEFKLEEPKIIFPYEVKVDEKQYENLKKVETRALKRKAQELEN
ncbi:MAG: hypothetical protein GX931_01640 [Acholeplasmataceae bacterium]|jgi:hypothetical protein|nr:hypothetical protein [Acholeplasmataceae bacterium]